MNKDIENITEELMMRYVEGDLDPSEIFSVPGKFHSNNVYNFYKFITYFKLI